MHSYIYTPGRPLQRFLVQPLSVPLGAKSSKPRMESTHKQHALSSEMCAQKQNFHLVKTELIVLGVLMLRQVRQIIYASHQPSQRSE